MSGVCLPLLPGGSWVVPSPHVKAGLRPPPKGRLTALTRGLGTAVSAPGFRRWPLANGPAGVVPTFPTSAKNYGFRPASTMNASDDPNGEDGARLGFSEKRERLIPPDAMYGIPP